jgi:hypothetical protein
MKRAEMLKLAKANGVKIPFGSKTHEALKVLKDAGVELPADVEADMGRVVDDAKAKDRAVWAAAQGGEVEEVAPAAEVPSEAAVEARKPRLTPRDDAFVHLFNSLEPGRGYTCPELTEMGGFGVTDAHFEAAVARGIAFPKSGGRWVRRPKNLGENLL